MRTRKDALGFGAIGYREELSFKAKILRSLSEAV